MLILKRLEASLGIQVSELLMASEMFLDLVIQPSAMATRNSPEMEVLAGNQPTKHTILIRLLCDPSANQG